MIDVAVVMEWVTRLGGLAGIAAVAGIAWTIKHGVKGDERQARAQEASDRRDTIADRDGLIDQLQEDVTRLHGELESARAAATTEIGDLKRRLETVERDLYLERAWNRTLIDQIYRGEPPPPRARPTD